MKAYKQPQIKSLGGYHSCIGVGLLYVLLLVGCTEFISPNITQNTITVIAPTDSLFTNRSELSFWWEQDSEVESYGFQMVTPDFTAPLVLLDTLISDDILTLYLEEELYTWRVQGINEGSETSAVTRVLVIDQSPPLIPVNLSPDTLTTGSQAILTWDSRDSPLGATGLTYPVEDSIRIFERGDSSRVLVQASTDTQKQFPISVNLDLQGPGIYYWQVRSRDQAGNLRVSDQFHFVVTP